MFKNGNLDFFAKWKKTNPHMQPQELTPSRVRTHMQGEYQTEVNCYLCHLQVGKYHWVQ